MASLGSIWCVTNVRFLHTPEWPKSEMISHGFVCAKTRVIFNVQHASAAGFYTEPTFCTAYGVSQQLRSFWAYLSHEPACAE